MLLAPYRAGSWRQWPPETLDVLTPVALGLAALGRGPVSSEQKDFQEMGPPDRRLGGSLGNISRLQSQNLSQYLLLFLFRQWVPNSWEEMFLIQEHSQTRVEGDCFL